MSELTSFVRSRVGDLSAASSCRLPFLGGSTRTTSSNALSTCALKKSANKVASAVNIVVHLINLSLLRLYFSSVFCKAFFIVRNFVSLSASLSENDEFLGQAKHNSNERGLQEGCTGLRKPSRLALCCLFMLSCPFLPQFKFTSKGF